MTLILTWSRARAPTLCNFLETMFGRILINILQSSILCSPNDDFGSPNEPLGTHFRSNFKVTSPNRVLTLWKVLRKFVPERSFGPPKSSFGEHKFRNSKKHVRWPDPEIPDLKMFIRARNAVWLRKRAIGIRGFRGLSLTDRTVTLNSTLNQK